MKQIKKTLRDWEVVPLGSVRVSMLTGSPPIPPHERLRVDKLDSLMGLLAAAMSYPRGIKMCTCGASPPAKTKPAPLLVSLDISSHPCSQMHFPPPLNSLLRFGVLFTQNCKCLVVTMTYCLGQCSFPMHTNILWLLYMNIFNDMGKVVDFLFSFFFLRFFSFFWLEL